MAGDLSQGLSDMWRSVLVFVPAALAFILILIIGYFVARLVRTLVGKGLRRVGFDKAVERGAVGRAVPGGKLDASGLLARIAFSAVLLFALQLAFGIWGPNPVSDLLTSLIAWLPRAFVAIIIIVVAAAIARAAHDLITNALGGLAYGRLLARAASFLIIALGVIAALDQVRIATSVTQPLLIAVLATVAGVLIVGVGGGLIRPMQYRWEVWLDKASQESTAIRQHARTYAVEKARIAEEARAAEVARIAEEARLAAEARAADEARKAEEARLAAEARAAEEARKAEEARVAEEARRAEEARKAEEARVTEEARVADQARLAEERAAEETRRAEEARKAEEVRKAEEARLAEKRAADEARQAEERVAEQARQAEERVAEQARQAEERAAEQTRQAVERTAEQARQADVARVAEEARAEEQPRTGAAGDAEEAAADDTPTIGDLRASEETQIIPSQPSRSSVEPYDDRPHLIPGFDRDEPEHVDDADTTAIISGPPRTESDRTLPLPRVGDSEAVEETQVIPTDTPDGPPRPRPRRRR
jgi:hypothetical protein